MSPVPLEPWSATRAGLDEAWATLGRPGDWWSAAERRQLATQARAARSCRLCEQRRASLSPYSVEGSHAASHGLSAAVVDAVHRIVTDPGRLSEQWFDEVVSTGVEPAAVSEIAGLIGVVVIGDTLAAGLGQPERWLPDAEPGEPARELPVGLRVEGGWVPMVHPESAEGQTRIIYEMVQHAAGFVFNVVRALTASPVAARGFFGAFAPNYMTHGPVPAGGLTRPQVELLASSTSALNDCFY